MIDPIKAFADSIEWLSSRIHNLESQEVSPTADSDLSVSFANLPTGFNGRKRWCSNCCKVGEASGAGSGTQVQYSNGAWRRVRDDAVASI